MECIGGLTRFQIPPIPGKGARAASAASVQGRRARAGGAVGDGTRDASHARSPGGEVLAVAMAAAVVTAAMAAAAAAAAAKVV